MVTDRFGQRVQSWQCTCSMVAALCLLVGSVAGCTRSDGVTINVVKASVSGSSAITLRIRIEEKGAYKVSELLTTGTTETLLGEAESIGRGESEFTNVFHTDEPSSVQFLVKQGEPVFVPIGAEKDLLQFTPRGEQKSVAARYTIRVRRAAVEKSWVEKSATGSKIMPSPNTGAQKDASPKPEN
jgi:hypothetical protein